MTSIDKFEGSRKHGVLSRSPMEATSAHIELTAFHEVIEYVVRLRRSGYLEDNTFADLVHYAAATFIEAEIDRKINHVFDNKFTSDRIMRFLR